MTKFVAALWEIIFARQRNLSIAMICEVRFILIEKSRPCNKFSIGKMSKAILKSNPAISDKRSRAGKHFSAGQLTASFLINNLCASEKVHVLCFKLSITPSSSLISK